MGSRKDYCLYVKDCFSKPTYKITPNRGPISLVSIKLMGVSRTVETAWVHFTNVTSNSNISFMNFQLETNTQNFYVQLFTELIVSIPCILFLNYFSKIHLFLQDLEEAIAAQIDASERAKDADEQLEFEKQALLEVGH